MNLPPSLAKASTQLHKKLLPLLICLGCGVYLAYDRLASLWLTSPLAAWQGPSEASHLPPAAATDPSTYRDAAAGDSRLAVYLPQAATAGERPWLPLLHALKTIGIPFTVATSAEAARQHQVVLIYPATGADLDQAQAAWHTYAATGGTVIAVDARGAFAQALTASGPHPELKVRSLSFHKKAAALLGLGEGRDSTLILSRAGHQEVFNPVSYAGAPPGSGERQVWATYGNGAAGIITRQVGLGRVIALGFDAAALIAVGYSNRDEGLARSYVNQFEPAIDIVLRLFRTAYTTGNELAVTLGTVPAGKELALVLTHDVDYVASMANSLDYAKAEREAEVAATYFIQTKYLRDYDDVAFYDREGIGFLRRVQALNMEIASHSVAHSRQFAHFALGTGQERYPAYRPVVRSRELTEGGTILGELRVSKFLLEKTLDAPSLASFRPGDLANPYQLPQALVATGFSYSSSVTANNSLTHLPFKLTMDRQSRQELPVYEFPVTIEDEEQPPLLERLAETTALAGRLAKYGGHMVVLIHPNETGDKLVFTSKLIEAWRQRAWFGTLKELGDWWVARDQTTWDVQQSGAEMQLTLRSPRPLHGLPLQVPKSWTLAQEVAAPAALTQKAPGLFILDKAAGKLELHFTRRSAD